MIMQAKERILVVDDEPQMLVALEDLLDEDFDVVKSDSAERALELALHDDFAVVISDQRMPKMTGEQLFSSLHQRSRATRILITGFADLNAVIRAVNDGAIFAYVTKPWKPEDFRLMVKRGVDYFRMAQELENKQQLLNDLMSNVPDGVYFKDPELVFKAVNRPYAQLLGVSSPSLLLGRRLTDVMQDDLGASRMEDAERLVLSEGLADADFVRTVPRGGNTRWISQSRAPIRNTDGKLMGLVGIARDVTERVTMEEALRASEERLQLIFRASGAGLFDWNLQSDEIYCSRSFGRLLEWIEAEATVTRERLLGLVHPADLAPLEAAVRTHIAERTPLSNFELRLRLPGGSYRWVLLNGQAVWDERGQATRLAGSISDISIRKRHEDRIARLTRIHAVRGAISSAIVRLGDRQALLTELCRAAIDIGRFSLAAVLQVGQPGEPLSLASVEPAEHPFIARFGELLAANYFPEYSAIAQVMKSQRAVVVNDVRVEQKPPTDQHTHWGAIGAFPLVIDGRLDGILTLFSETSGFFDGEEEKLLEELSDNLSFALSHIAQGQRLDQIAHYDALTALPNRLLLRDRLTQRIASVHEENDKFALLLLDVSRFRHVNETFGWAGGDQLLGQIARRVSGTLNARDTLARLDGNAFAILFSSVEDAAEVALFVENQLSPALKLPFNLGDAELRVALRAGIALFPADGETADALIGNAGTALRNAKGAGLAYRFYAPHMNARVAEKLTLETKLRRAIENDEFLLHYQPKVDFKSGELVGLEALVRWREPSGSLVPPGQFIPLLEETGLIVDAGRWILECAARQQADWIARGFSPPRIAVNVSAGQLAQADFVSVVDALLARFPQAAQGLDLEITESVFVDDVTHNADKLRAVRQRGLQVAIDDFGTGYSSLGYLSRLPIDALKIDRSFVVRMFEGAEDMAIVSTIISLAHALELKVVAEGVETKQQAEQLRLLRCDQLQGYLTAKPQAATDVEQLFGKVLLNVERRPSERGR